MTDLIALAERVEVGSGSDKQLDTEVARARGWSQRPSHNGGLIWQDREGRQHYDDPRSPPAVSSSLDAVVSLAEEMLPGWQWMVHVNSSGIAWGYVADAGIAVGAGYSGKVAKSPARALLAAILRARATATPVLPP